MFERETLRENNYFKSKTELLKKQESNNKIALKELKHEIFTHVKIHLAKFWVYKVNTKSVLLSHYVPVEIYQSIGAQVSNACTNLCSCWLLCT